MKLQWGALLGGAVIGAVVGYVMGAKAKGGSVEGLLKQMGVRK